MKTFIVCATPRSGSTFLCDGLRLIGGLPDPKEYLIPQYIETFRDQHPAYRQADFATTVEAIFDAHRTRGVLALKVMWEAWEAFRHEMAHPGESTEDLLQRCLGDTRFLCLQRRDFVAQAISHFKAELTDTWFDYGQPIERRATAADYNFDRIFELANYSIEINQRWKQFFAEHTVQPLWMFYEDLIADFENEMRRALTHLHGTFEGPIAPDRIPLKKMADSVSEEFRYRFKMDCVERGFCLAQRGQTFKINIDEDI